MGFFDIEKNCDQYEKMAADYDGTELIEILDKFTNMNDHILELGMGPGKDFDIIRKKYRVTGSDSSEVFVNRYLKRDPDAEVQILDAVTLNTSTKFDVIYSNKVLHHLTRDDFRSSMKRQVEVVKSGGRLFHTFWYGDKVESYSDLLFNYYNEETLTEFIPEKLKVIRSEIYQEDSPADSMLVVFEKMK
jgi:trans-aconitate methyltransferase